MVKVVAHRGFGEVSGKHAASFREALALNVDTVEFDVRLTKERRARAHS